MTFQKNTELDQANLRIIVTVCAIGYISVLGFLPGHEVERTRLVLLATAPTAQTLANLLVKGHEAR